MIITSPLQDNRAVLKERKSSGCSRSQNQRSNAMADPHRILQPEGYKSRINRMWRSRGRTYDRSDNFHGALAAKLVGLAADLQPGQTVLDVATGTGMVALQIAEKVGNAGLVTGIDISESMLAAVHHFGRC